MLLKTAFAIEMQVDVSNGGVWRGQLKAGERCGFANLTDGGDKADRVVRLAIFSDQVAIACETHARLRSPLHYPRHRGSGCRRGQPPVVIYSKVVSHYLAESPCSADRRVRSLPSGRST